MIYISTNCKPSLTSRGDVIIIYISPFQFWNFFFFIKKHTIFFRKKNVISKYNDWIGKKITITWWFDEGDYQVIEL